MTDLLDRAILDKLLDFRYKDEEIFGSALRTLKKMQEAFTEELKVDVPLCDHIREGLFRTCDHMDYSGHISGEILELLNDLGEFQCNETYFEHIWGLALRFLSSRYSWESISDLSWVDLIRSISRAFPDRVPLCLRVVLQSNPTWKELKTLFPMVAFFPAAGAVELLKQVVDRAPSEAKLTQLVDECGDAFREMHRDVKQLVRQRLSQDTRRSENRQIVVDACQLESSGDEDVNAGSEKDLIHDSDLSQELDNESQGSETLKMSDGAVNPSHSDGASGSDEDI
jgi:hypothetical protein